MSSQKILILRLATGTCLLCYRWLFTYRLIQVSKPLHYKRLVTKGRLHQVFTVMSSVAMVQFGCAILFLRRDFTQYELCIASNLVSSTGYYTVILLNFGILTLVTAISYIWVIITLKQQKKYMSVLMQSRNSGVLSTNSKLPKQFC